MGWEVEEENECYDHLLTWDQGLWIWSAPNWKWELCVWCQWMEFCEELLSVLQRCSSSITILLIYTPPHSTKYIISWLKTKILRVLMLRAVAPTQLSRIPLVRPIISAIPKTQRLSVSLTPFHFPLPPPVYLLVIFNYSKQLSPRHHMKSVQREVVVRVAKRSCGALSLWFATVTARPSKNWKSKFMTSMITGGGVRVSAWVGEWVSGWVGVGERARRWAGGWVREGRMTTKPRLGHSFRYSTSTDRNERH